MRLVSVLALIVATLASCTESTGPADELEVATDRSTYVVGSSVVLTIRNRTAAAAYFNHCDHRLGFMLQAQDGDAWVDAQGMDNLDCPPMVLPGVMVLEPGDSYTTSFRIDAPGTYRAEFETGPDPQSIGSEDIYSNPFEVTG